MSTKRTVEGNIVTKLVDLMILAKEHDLNITVCRAQAEKKFHELEMERDTPEKIVLSLASAFVSAGTGEQLRGLIERARLLHPQTEMPRDSS